MTGCTRKGFAVRNQCRGKRPVFSPGNQTRVMRIVGAAAMVLASGLWAVGCGWSGTVSAQDPWDRVPADAVAAMVVQHPDQLAGVFQSFFDKTESPELVELVTSEPHPLGDVEQLEAFRETVRRLLDSLGNASRLTVFVVGPGPDWRYCAVLELQGDDVPERVGTDLDALVAMMEASGATEERNAAGSKQAEEGVGSPAIEQQSTDVFLELCGRLFRNLKPAVVRGEGSLLIVSNSVELADQAMEGDGQGNTEARARSITRDRRFLRARGSAGEGRSPVVSAYFQPRTVLPWLDAEKYTGEEMELQGYSELVGAWCQLGIAPALEQDSGPRLEFSISVPHTEPAVGISEYWKCTTPIQTVPDIRDLLEKCEVQPERLRITSGNRKEMLESLLKTWAAAGKQDEYEASLKAAPQWYSGVDERRRFIDGYKFEFAFHSSVLNCDRPFIGFVRHDDPEQALEYVRATARHDNRALTNPTEAVQFGDYEGWFRSRESAKQQAILDGADETSARDGIGLRNNGMLAVPRWIVHCDRQIAEVIDGQLDIAEVDHGDVLDELLPGLADIIGETQPWWIEIRWPEKLFESILYGTRRAYFSLQLGRIAGGRKLSRNPPPEPFAVESRPDRFYLVTEWLTRQAIENLGADVKAFSCREQCFEWSWRNLPSVKR